MRVHVVMFEDQELCDIVHTHLMAWKSHRNEQMAKITWEMGV